MDAFYAAIEQRDDPALRGRPVIVGADPRGGRGRGVVSTASYEARPFGVGSAMPISQAYRLCPQAVYLPVDMEKYVAVSRQVMEILLRASDLVEPLSIDEAFVDVTGSRRVLGDGEAIARRIQQHMRDELRLTASVGVATSKLVAKIASDMRKPDGLVVVPPGGEAAFLAPLPVRRLWGVGPTLEAALAKLGVHTIGALAALPPERLERRLGTHGHDLRALARGEDDRAVIASGEAAKSMGHEHTYDSDTGDLARLRRTLLDLSDAVAHRLRSHGLRARTLTLKYRDETFRTLTRAATLAAPVDSGNELFRCAWTLFQGVHGRRKVRLLGLSASHFGEARGQFDLFREPTPPADRLRDALAERFGDGAVTRASQLRPAAETRPSIRAGRRPSSG
jgi:nucleotidyltransferase/DNA polymerase involved in DNA repair